MYAVSKLTIPASVSSARPGYASAACHGFRVPVPCPHIGRRSWRHALRESFCIDRTRRDSRRRGLRSRNMDTFAKLITTVSIVRNSSTAKPYRSSQPAATGTRNSARNRVNNSLSLSTSLMLLVRQDNSRARHVFEIPTFGPNFLKLNSVRAVFRVKPV